jgi:lipoprotein-anchoring transpeptidase ErfK/SrfK
VAGRQDGRAASRADPVRHRFTLPLIVVLALGAAGQAHGGRVSPPGRATGADVAKVVAVAAVRPRPGAGPIVRLLATRTSWSGDPQELLVLGARTGADGREWLRVRLPGRPNGSAGWISQDAVLVRHVRWWIDVSLSQRLVRVFRDGTMVRRMHAVVGAPQTPTPTGLFAVYEPIAQPGGGTRFIGSWALHLTAFSNVLENYGGGPGRVAIHGRGGASLADPLGTARSHGCVRLANADVDWLARSVVPGTPVQIHR